MSQLSLLSQCPPRLRGKKIFSWSFFMPEFVNVAKITDLAAGESMCVEVNGRKIGLFNLGGTFYAIDNICTHAHAQLSEGEVSGEEVACPLHFATFNIKTGTCTAPPADEDLATYPVRVVGDDIEIEV